MTLLQMVEQGEVLQLVIMGGLFIFMGIMINRIGGKAAGQKGTSNDTSASQKADDMPAVTAAITAAVNEHRKNQ
jgi:Na+-transporting methylmalonyl-CoA/oxaloacetate decarboxylase gamma subunit